MVQQIFTLVPRLNPSLGFVTAQEIQNTTNNNNKTQRRNLDSGALRPRVIKWEIGHGDTKTFFVGTQEVSACNALKEIINHKLYWLA